jgi:thiol-disulfide isomerase/thioredoxin
MGLAMTHLFLDLTRVFRLICFLALAVVSSSAAALEPWVWIDNNAAGERQVHLYFFWTSTCPHCQAARPFVEGLPARHPWLVLHSRNLTTDPNAADAYVAMAESLGQEASSVPAFLFCGQLEVGFDRPETTGQALEEALQFCRESGAEPALGEPAAGTRSGSRDSISRYSAQWRPTNSRYRCSPWSSPAWMPSIPVPFSFSCFCSRC